MRLATGIETNARDNAGQAAASERLQELAKLLSTGLVWMVFRAKHLLASSVHVDMHVLDPELKASLPRGK